MSTIYARVLVERPYGLETEEHITIEVLETDAGFITRVQSPGRYITGQKDGEIPRPAFDSILDWTHSRELALEFAVSWYQGNHAKELERIETLSQADPPRIPLFVRGEKMDGPSPQLF